MAEAPWRTLDAAAAPEVRAPDGAIVHVLAAASRGSMARFTLPPGAVSRAVAHRSVEEVWLVLSGTGRMWRRAADGAAEEVVALVPGLSLTIPVGTRFQFRADGDAPLVALGVTMPPWPGEAEAVFVEGRWPPSV